MKRFISDGNVCIMHDDLTWETDPNKHYALILHEIAQMARITVSPRDGDAIAAVFYRVANLIEATQVINTDDLGTVPGAKY